MEMVLSTKKRQGSSFKISKSQTEFDECFRIFDKDGSSKIEKKELEFFINILAGL